MVRFCVVASVADPEATIKALATERSKQRLRQRRSTILESTTAEERGGLLTGSILSSGRENELSEEPSYFANRGRRTGRSLHCSRPRTEIKQASIYKLEFVTSQHLGTTINESITFILPIRYIKGKCETALPTYHTCALKYLFATFPSHFSQSFKVELNTV